MINVLFNNKYIFYILLVLTYSSTAQQVFVSQDFEDPLTMDWTLNEAVPFLGTVSSYNNTFLVNNEYAGGFVDFEGFLINVGNTTDQGFQANSNYLHTAAFDAINANDGLAVLNATYIDAAFGGVLQESICAVTPDYSTMGFTGVDMSYWWHSGPTETEFGTQVFYSLNQGTNWVLVDGPLSADMTWQLANYDFGDVLDNQPNVRFAFVFYNRLDNHSYGPILANGFGLDDFKLIADCDFELPEDYTVCSGESTTIHANTTWYNTFAWSTGSLADSVTIEIIEDTTISITASNDYCSIQDQITVFAQTERVDLGLNVNDIGIPCYGDCNGELQLEVTNGTPKNDGSYTIQWMDSLMNPININVTNSLLNNFTSTLSDVCEGMYYVSVHDAVCTISEIDSIFFSYDLASSIENSINCFNVELIQNDLCNSNGVIQVISSHPYSIEVQFPNFTTAIYNSAQDTITLTGLYGGDYTITSLENVDLSENIYLSSDNVVSSLFSPSFYTNGYGVNCYGDCNGDIFLSIINQSEIYSINWYLDSVSDSPLFTSSTATSITSYQNNLCAGDYIFELTSSSGCVSYRNYTLRQPDSLFVEVISSEVFCPVANGDVEIDVSGGVGERINPNTGNVIDTLDYSFSWTGPNSYSSIDEDISNLAFGHYTITVTDDNGCTAIDSTYIEINICGCMDSIALNFNSDATLDDSSCVYCEELTNTFITIPASSINVCNGIGIVETTGGQEPYHYYWDGVQSSNISYLCSGFNILTTYYQNVCVHHDTIFIGPENYGCMDSLACNYDLNANLQDSSCIYPTTNLDCDFNCINDADSDGICDEEEVYGCTDSNSPNYNLEATEDDGTCIECNLELEYISSNSSSQESCNGIIGVIVNNTVYDYTIYINNSPLISNYNIHSCYGQNEVYVEDEQGCTVSDFYFLNSNQIVGCTDYTASNYNVLANSDDGSCEYEETDNPCEVIPSGLIVDNIIHNRVRFNWSSPQVLPSHYMIRYRPLGTNAWTVMTAGTVNDIPFNGTSRTRYFMQPETTYEWSIRARVLYEDGSTNCQSPWSASHQYTTLPTCANIENLAVSTEANWVILSADAPSSNWGVWQSKGKLRELGSNSFRYVNGDSSGNINDLKGNFEANTDYEWHTKAWCTGNVDEDGNSDPQYHSGWGEFSDFTTEESCDKLPTNLVTTTNGSQNLITMNWDTPLSGEPDHYFLELNNETTGQLFQWNNIAGSATSKTKYNQVSGHSFSWRIRGACGTNGTSWATVFTLPKYYTMGASRLSNLNKLNVYPNPSRDVFNVSFNVKQPQDIKLEIVNILGEVIYKENNERFEGFYLNTFDMINESNGIYLLKIYTDSGIISNKLTLQ